MEKVAIILNDSQRPTLSFTSKPTIETHSKAKAPYATYLMCMGWNNPVFAILSSNEIRLSSLLASVYAKNRTIPHTSTRYVMLHFMFRHVLKIPRKGSIVVPCIALHCLFAFIWHLLLSLSVA